MRRLEKVESRNRWSQLRDLWNEFDPIGVMNYENWPLDEYENYCGPVMRLLEKNAPDMELETYVRSVCDYMGMQPPYGEIQNFVRKLQQWFQENWSNTQV